MASRGTAFLGVVRLVESAGRRETRRDRCRQRHFFAAPLVIAEQSQVFLADPQNVKILWRLGGDQLRQQMKAAADGDFLGADSRGRIGGFEARRAEQRYGRSAGLKRQ